MANADRGAVPYRFIVVQLVLVLALVGLYKVYLPHRQKAEAADAAVERDARITKFFQNAVKEDRDRTVEVPAEAGGGQAHPQSLREDLSVGDVEKALGAPDSQSIDFAGGEHLIWKGASHKLEASFNKGRLYCLVITDLSTGHGSLIFVAPEQWRPF
jgi:hypothetical protein